MEAVEQEWIARVRAAAGGRRILGIMGGGAAGAADLDAAAALGRLAAAAGLAVLTGGGPGIMEAASRGARAAGGLTLGVLPVAAPSSRYPNPFVAVPFFTGLGIFDRATGAPGRNRINVLAACVIAALPGAAGTHSEIRLAAAHSRPLVLVGWRTADLEPATRAWLDHHGVRPAAAPTPVAAIRWIQASLRATGPRATARRRRRPG
ncbi:MAG: hypothetical protein JXQ29_04290 [Planctomycetes bacterium]|nr:hypothetical protein [Planctomycetota bacterium]